MEHTSGPCDRLGFDYIEGWYSPRRRHSALAYLSPMAYEKQALVQV